MAKNEQAFELKPGMVISTSIEGEPMGWWLVVGHTDRPIYKGERSEDGGFVDGVILACWEKGKIEMSWEVRESRIFDPRGWGPGYQLVSERTDDDR